MSGSLPPLQAFVYFWFEYDYIGAHISKFVLSAGLADCGFTLGIIGRGQI